MVALLLWESFRGQTAVHGRERQSDQKATQQGQVPASLLLKKGIPGRLPGGRAPLLPRINIRGKWGKGVWSLVNTSLQKSLQSQPKEGAFRGAIINFITGALSPRALFSVTISRQERILF